MMLETAQPAPIAYSKSLQKQIKGAVTKKKYQDKVEQVNALLQPLQAPWAYKNDEIQRKGKECLLIYWDFLLREASNATLGDRHTFFTEMVLIIRRREFDIFSLEWKDGRLLSSGADRKLAVRYHDLLVETMLFCINKLAKTGAYTALMEFSSKVLAVCYFCFPSLTKATLDGVWPDSKEKSARKEDIELGEDIAKLLQDSCDDGNSSGSLYASLEQSNSKKAFKQMRKYYLAIDDHGNASKLTHHTSWLKRFNNESIHYVGLLVDIVDQAAYLTAGESVQWEMVPGYAQLVHAFLFQLKHKMGINEWKTRAATQCVSSLMQNPRLFNIFIKVLYSKTNINDASLTETSLEILSEWFLRVRETYTYLPRDFDYDYFFQGLVIMLDCEHHVTLIKALTFIYNTLHMYLEKPRRRFVQEIIFKRFFFKFFLHWHPQVRGIYHQLIIFKAARVREEFKRMRRKDIRIPTERKTDRLARGLREAYVEAVRQRIGWNDQKREEIIRSQPPSPSHIIKTLKKEAKAKEAEAEDAAAQANNGKDNNGKDNAGGKKIGKKEKKEKEKKEKEKEKLEEERKRRDSREDASMAKNKRKSSDGGLNGKANGKKEKDKIRSSLGKGELNGADSNGRQGGKRWRKKERKEKGKEKKDQENGSRGNESDDGEEERSSDYSEEVKKVTLKIGEEEFPPCLEVYAGASLLKYEETAEHWVKWADAVEMFPDGSVHYPDMNSLVLSTPKADREL
ncbi:uncharacterized protein ACA1_073380 [Acanthamoeba castellanii str. Neff]|uniref:Uncharacterized protein n=1 Tax=Acanthamoeba castellanii (strain ATCC 30010 / Neff) TaxID=1257118 RepID=L8HDU9_ACACF|nr:uncharacterized protein ACA1_073380 [Acanthamoeba castellanii str. Neff]ELR23694.1 hypothetical protein ACA1_073380 [Acanthamoeba castellanii str. Neff]